MEIYQALLLGILQGLTEFFPISSSGHLVVLQHFLGFKEPILMFDIVLHLGTLLAVVTFLKTEILGILTTNPLKDRDSAYLWLNPLLALIPTGIIGLFIEKKANYFFGSTAVVGIMFFITGLLLLLPKFIRLSYSEELTPIKALFIGVSQGIAAIPGISRSGITIITGLLFGLKGDKAGRFSFLIFCPAILGALGLEFLKAYRDRTWDPYGIPPYTYLLGFLTAFFVGYISLKGLMWVVKAGTHGRLHWFSPYCFLLGVLLLAFSRG